MANIYYRLSKLENEKMASNKDIITIISDLLQGKSICDKKLKFLANYESKNENSLSIRL